MERSLTLPPSNESLRGARSLADQVTGPSALCEAVRSVIAELTSNAVAHARTQFTVSVLQEPSGAVTVSVVDGDAGRPVMKAIEPKTVGGRGLRIVDALADRWGVTPVAGDGKSVWAHLLAP